jgi:two-component system, LuxR family, response regulator DctR
MKPTVFVVDDDAEVRDAVAFTLRQSGHAVRSFADGREVLSVVDGLLPQLRAIFVLDVRMEPLSGPALHDGLIARGLQQRAPVIFLSGHGDIPVAVAAMSKGAFDFVEKPNIDRLRDKVGQAVVKEAEWFERHCRSSQLRDLWESLSPQQSKVALRVAAGMLNKVIAYELVITERMVEEHRRKVYEKLGVGSAAEVATTLAALRSVESDLNR